MLLLIEPAVSVLQCLLPSVLLHQSRYCLVGTHCWEQKPSTVTELAVYLHVLLLLHWVHQLNFSGTYAKKKKSLQNTITRNLFITLQTYWISNSLSHDYVLAVTQLEVFYYDVWSIYFLLFICQLYKIAGFIMAMYCSHI